MIIQIRGTSGSGKTTAVKAFMTKIGKWEAVIEEGRKKPIWYESQNEYYPRVIVLGHYEAACGGCDTIGSAKAVYELIERIRARDRLFSKDCVIVCEGLLLSEDVKWSSLLGEMEDLRVLYLQTPLDQCLDQIKSRRAEAGNTEPLNPHNTTNRFRVIERSRQRLMEAGVQCFRTTMRQVPGIILGWLSNV